MIIPTVANSDGTVGVVCEYCTATKSKTLATTHVAFAVNGDGTTNPHLMQLSCPDCGASTFHPIQGDGSCRSTVRDMFARTIERLSCPKGDCVSGNYTAAQAHVVYCNGMLGGPP